MFPVEEVGGGERLIVHHGMLGLDCPVFTVPLRFLCLSYWHLEGACAWPGAQPGSWSQIKWILWAWGTGETDGGGVSGNGGPAVDGLGGAYGGGRIVYPWDLWLGTVEAEISVGLLWAAWMR